MQKLFAFPFVIKAMSLKMYVPHETRVESISSIRFVLSQSHVIRININKIISEDITKYRIAALRVNEKCKKV